MPAGLSLMSAPRSADMDDMTACAYCGALAVEEYTRVMTSTDGPVLVTKWRCLQEFTHWWTEATDALTDSSARAA